LCSVTLTEHVSGARIAENDGAEVEHRSKGRRVGTERGAG